MLLDCQQIKIFCGHKKLLNHEIFDAEARAVLLGLQTALKNPNVWHSTNIYICLDNLKAVQQLQDQSKESSKSVSRSFQGYAQTWPHLLRASGIQAGRVYVKRVPGHIDIVTLKTMKKPTKKSRWAVMLL